MACVTLDPNGLLLATAEPTMMLPAFLMPDLVGLYQNSAKLESMKYDFLC